jgi:gliding motility-associated-like protein
MLKFSRILSFVSAIAFSAILSAQAPVQEVVPISAQVYNGLKAQGLLNPNAKYVFTDPIASGTLSPASHVNHSSRAQLSAPPCGYIPTTDFLDPWGGDVYFDDGPPAGPFEVQIPFDFCFYGTNYNSFFINNNGNITFEEAYATFTAQAFPAAGIPAMIAPFWGDVDTGSDLNPLGQVRYDVYPEYAVVSWDTVAVYPENGALRNTFQLLISNGTSSVLPPGSNIAFIYADMQWTTGDASDGENGFGGTPATVGVNRGDGIDYIQLGRFDAPGTNYDGPFGNPDQVSFLDNTVFFFNTCLQPGAQNNIAPLAIGAPLCDTIVVCSGSTYDLDFDFIPVEPGQTVDAALITDAVPGFTLGTVTPGTTCNVQGAFTGGPGNLGYNTITFTATDNGTPAAAYTINLVFQVIENGFVPEILGVPFICSGDAALLSVGGGDYDEYAWSPNNESTSTINTTQEGEYTVTVIIDGCIGTSDPYTVATALSPEPVVLGEDTVCNTQVTQLYTADPYNSYLWSTPSNQDTISVSAGSYIVTVTDTNGCTGTSAPFVVSSISAIIPVIVGDNHTCFNETAQLATATEYVNYEWSNNTFGSLAIVTPGSYTVTVEDENGCIGTSQPFVVGNSTPTPFIDGYERFCKFDTIELFLNDTFDTYRWIYLNDTLSTADTLTWTGGTPDNDDVVVIVTDEFGCVGVDTLNAPYTELPVAGLTYEPNTAAVLVNTPINFSNTSTPGAGDTVSTWFWIFNNPPAGEDTVYLPSPTESFPDTGAITATIIVTTELGCKDTLTIPIQIIDKPFVPNVFSPNGDGKNDFFVIPFLSGYPENQVVVYSRWGKVVYEGTNYKSDWNGDNVPSGTYFYVVSAPTLSEPLKGTVTIIQE